MTIKKEQLKEANVTLDLVDFETSDLNALSDIFRLAGVAASEPVTPTMTVPPVIGGGGSPADHGFVDLSGFDEPDVTPEVEPVDPMGGLDDAPLALPSPEDADIPVDSPDLGTEPVEPVEPDVLLANPSDEPLDPVVDGGEFGPESDEDPELQRLGELAGINDIDRDDPMIKENSRLLPNLDLSEDDFDPLGDDGMSDQYGPFGTEDECKADAIAQTSGVEGNNFTVIPGNDGFYWTRTLGENFSNEPETVVANTDAVVDGINYAVEPKRTNLGDNKMIGLSESVEEIYDDISAKFRKYFNK